MSAPDEQQVAQDQNQVPDQGQTSENVIPSASQSQVFTDVHSNDSHVSKSSLQTEDSQHVSLAMGTHMVLERSSSNRSGGGLHTSASSHSSFNRSSSTTPGDATHWHLGFGIRLRKSRSSKVVDTEEDEEDDGPMPDDDKENENEEIEQQDEINPAGNEEFAQGNHDSPFWFLKTKKKLRGRFTRAKADPNPLAANVRNFFEVNKDNLVRPNIQVEEIEQKKARTWVLMLVVLQAIVNIVYATSLWQMPTSISIPLVAYGLGTYFVLKLLCVTLFLIRHPRVLVPTICASTTNNQHNQKLERILVCIPCYNESKEAFERTIVSIYNSNYPRNKLFMLFIVDGNKANCFQNLMAALTNRPYTKKVPPNTRMLESGLYPPEGEEQIPYMVFLKEENRGKRDSQWLFVEIIRNLLPQLKPPFVLFVDSDTAFEPNAIKYMRDDLKRDPKAAGVCGQLTLSNFSFDDNTTWDDVVFTLSSLFIVGYQYYEYHFNQILGKQAEGAFNSVTCLPGAFSLFRADVLCNVEVVSSGNEIHAVELSEATVIDMDPAKFVYISKVANTKAKVQSDFFSKSAIGIIDRNLYELGEDRTLTVRMLEMGYHCLYEPRAIALTECPFTVVNLIQQRRRWSNSTFINLLMIPLKKSLWKRKRTIPIFIFSMFDLVGSYLLPANAILLMRIVWAPLVDALNQGFGFELEVDVLLFWWVAIQVLVIATRSLRTSDLFFVLSTFISGALMTGALWFWLSEQAWGIVTEFIREWPNGDFPRIVLIGIFPLLHLIVSIPKPVSFLSSIFYWIMLPTSSITIPLYSFFHLDDFTWGSR